MILNETCQCGLVRFVLTLANPIENYIPRACDCDCDFCLERNIAYLSDPESRLKINSKSKLKKYQQGSNQAVFLACEQCDDMIAVVLESKRKFIGAVNASLLRSKKAFRLAKAEPAFPKLLTANEKVARWEEIWMEVKIFHPR